MLELRGLWPARPASPPHTRFLSIGPRFCSPLPSRRPHVQRSAVRSGRYTQLPGGLSPPPRRSCSAHQRSAGTATKLNSLNGQRAQPRDARARSFVAARGLWREHRQRRMMRTAAAVGRGQRRLISTRGIILRAENPSSPAMVVRRNRLDRRRLASVHPTGVPSSRDQLCRALCRRQERPSNRPHTGAQEVPGLGRRRRVQRS